MTKRTALFAIQFLNSSATPLTTHSIGVIPELSIENTTKNKIARLLLNSQISLTKKKVPNYIFGSSTT